MNTISEVASSEDDGGGHGSSSDVSHASSRQRTGRGSSAAFVNYNRVRISTTTGWQTGN